MSQTTQAVPPSDSGTSGGGVVAQQDAWVRKFTGEDVDRSKLALGGHRGQDTAPPTPQTPSPTWQRAEPKEGPQKPQERDTKLAQVDTALKGATDAVAAIASPVGRKLMDPAVAQVKTRRDALANASDRAEIAKQLAAVATLLADIEKVRAAAVQAKANWDAVAAKKKSAETDLANAKSWIGVAPAGATKTALTNEAAGIDTSLKALDSVATLKAYQDGVTAAQNAINALYQKAVAAGAPANATNSVKMLDPWLPVYKKLANPNAVSRTHKALTDRQAAAGGKPNPTNEYLAIASDASKAADDARKAYATWQAIDRFVKGAEANLSGLPDEQRNAIVAQRDVLLGKVGNNVTNAATPTALQGALLPLKTEAEVLQAQTINIGKQTAQVQASLADAKKAIDGLADGKSKTDFTKQYDALQKRLTAAPALTPLATQKSELVAIGKEALALVEATHKEGFAAQAATPEGKAKIDKMIQDFGASTDDPVKQAICRAAIAGCYNIPLDIPEGMSVKTLPAIYDMMAKVPKTHLAGLKGIEYETDPLMGSSYYVNGKVVLNKIGDGTSTYDMVNQADKSKKEQVNYFNATTLHELGHYVDDHNSVMGSNMAKPDFGGWKKVGTADVAAAYYPKFASFVGSGKKPTQADLLTLIETVLQSGTATKPGNATGPLGSLFADWDAIVASDGYKACLRIRNSDASPWDHPVPAPDGYSYHEGYAGDWYGYLTASRSKGISDYQWRAPAEWFAEQYAFYRLLPSKTKPANIASYLAM